jgi:hypothetical protein
MDNDDDAEDVQGEGGNGGGEGGDHPNRKKKNTHLHHSMDKDHEEGNAKARASLRKNYNKDGLMTNTTSSHATRSSSSNDNGDQVSSSLLSAGVEEEAAATEHSEELMLKIVAMRQRDEFSTGQVPAAAAAASSQEANNTTTTSSHSQAAAAVNNTHSSLKQRKSTLDPTKRPGAYAQAPGQTVLRRNTVAEYSGYNNNSHRADHHSTSHREQQQQQPQESTARPSPSGETSRESFKMRKAALHHANLLSESQTNSMQKDDKSNSPLQESASPPGEEEIARRMDHINDTASHRSREEEEEWEPHPDHDGTPSSSPMAEPPTPTEELIEATLVIPGEDNNTNTNHQELMVFQEAQALNDRELLWVFLKSPKGIVVLFVAFVIVTAAVTTPALLLTQTNNDNLSPSSLVPTKAPSEAPTSAPTQQFTLLDLPQATRQIIKRNNSDAPQNRAWEWVSNDPFLNEMEPFRKLQRFGKCINKWVLKI